MGFASTYLEERALYPPIFNEAPDKLTGIIVVIPAFNEPGIDKLLDCLALCRIPDCRVEVIVIVNAPAGEDEEIIENNKLTIENIESWKADNKSCFFRLFAFNVLEPVAGWGVGLARKTGMDEAVRRFDCINNPEGIILNLDADCLVEQNYFTAVCEGMLKKRDRAACSVYFEHPLSGDEFPETVYKSIALYELHLRYYFQALASTGFPYVFHTVGSAIAVKALPYVKAGGMNRRRAGEDFYFVQKLVPAGGYFSLNSTTVYPSPRVSTRVPFGTGASIGKLTKEAGSTLYTYNIQAFNELKMFFACVEQYYKCEPADLAHYYRLLPEGIRLFSDMEEWVNKILEIKRNTSGLSSFQKRFYGWFNMFRIVKYLNYVHQDYFQKKEVQIAAQELLGNIGSGFRPEDSPMLLNYYRMLERQSP